MHGLNEREQAFAWKTDNQVFKIYTFFSYNLLICPEWNWLLIAALKLRHSSHLYTSDTYSFRAEEINLWVEIQIVLEYKTISKLFTEIII